MKIWHTTALVIAVGLGLGFVATHGFAAQPKRAVYVVVEADEITDASRYEAMKKRGPANIVEAKFVNGRYLARTENVTSLDGTAPKGIVIIAFDNAAKAKAYYDNTKETTAKGRNRARSLLRCAWSEGNCCQVANRPATGA